MTTWYEYKKSRRLSGTAKLAYDRERARLGVGYLVLKARAAAGFSQAQLAKRLKTSQPMVARWESGKQLPSVRTLLRIADVTGFDLALGLRDRKTGRDFVQLGGRRRS